LRILQFLDSNFVMQEVSADKAYLSNANLQTVIDHHAQPYIPFKTNSTTEDRWQKKRSSRTVLWKQLYHLYSYNTERFMAQYHNAYFTEDER